MDFEATGETLRARRAALQRELHALTARPVEATPSVSFGKRVGDGTTEAVERINTTAAARSIAASLAEADRALAKLEEGSYGLCDRCGKPIGDERLEAIPWATLCVACAAGRAGDGRRVGTGSSGGEDDR
ncbi:MAG TPA: TraR/DksA C4-type zinc finger protein [Actinomycetota bacterium]|nr:TraR/DksA C4-type zinc finger protein [Actinomycetota bacterium]